MTTNNWRDEFHDKFVIKNKSSKTGYWWKVPFPTGSEEIADPGQVLAFIEVLREEAKEEGKSEERNRIIAAMGGRSPLIDEAMKSLSPHS